MNPQVLAFATSSTSTRWSRLTLSDLGWAAASFASCMSACIIRSLCVPFKHLPLYIDGGARIPGKRALNWHLCARILFLVYIRLRSVVSGHCAMRGVSHWYGSLLSGSGCDQGTGECAADALMRKNSWSTFPRMARSHQTCLGFYGPSLFIARPMGWYLLPFGLPSLLD